PERRTRPAQCVAEVGRHAERAEQRGDGRQDKRLAPAPGGAARGGRGQRLPRGRVRVASTLGRCRVHPCPLSDRVRHALARGGRTADPYGEPSYSAAMPPPAGARRLAPLPGRATGAPAAARRGRTTLWRSVTYVATLRLRAAAGR